MAASPSADVDQRADHDEQAHEEDERRPLDLLEVLAARRPRHDDEQARTEQGDDAGLEV